MVVEIDLTQREEVKIRKLLRDKGMAYTFVEGEYEWWSWRNMLTTFNDRELQSILGDGLVKICLQPCIGSYDHSRHNAANLGEGPPLTGKAPIWDFVVTQVDGTLVRFHPQQTQRKIKMSTGVPPPTEGPSAGLGESDGRGTYRGFADASYGWKREQNTTSDARHM